METKLGSIIDNIKNVNSKVILKAIKKSQENLKTKSVLSFASNAMNKATEMSKNEINSIVEKMTTIEKKTNKEIEKAVSLMLNKLLLDKSNENVTTEVKQEIVKKLAQYNRGKNIIPILRYVNGIIIKNAPKNVKSVKTFKKNVVNTLIQDANKRLEKKKKVA